MMKVLLTAFEPYDPWTSNSSWLTLVELTKDLPPGIDVRTRLYPVDYEQVRQRLTADLAEHYDVALHLGQAPGAAQIELEMIGINVRGSGEGTPDRFVPLADDGPDAYRSQLPLSDWMIALRQAGFPARLSFHAGTFLCNGTLYLSHHLVAKAKLSTQSTFFHIPLAPSQVINAEQNLASQPVAVTADAMRVILEQLRSDRSST